jgi:hypothetical protein
MVRETIGGSAFRVKNLATAKKDKRWMQSIKLHELAKKFTTNSDL